MKHYQHYVGGSLHIQGREARNQLITKGKKNKFLLRVPDKKKKIVKKFIGLTESSAIVIQGDDPTEYDDVMKIID